jgi:hypothetical protein
MIQTKPEFTIETEGNMPSAMFTLKQKNQAHVFGILRNNLYSDKILAVIREYSTNAHDANVDNGKPNEPIHVTIPSVIEPTFQVRDFGKGLSKEDVFEIYASYGESTKRESNEQIGTLGMGSKSGFAYSNSFTVTSWHNGTKSIYEAYIDETGIGTISQMYSEPSSEPSGIAVTIAVNNGDISNFAGKAAMFYQWFDPRPTFFGYDLNSVIDSNFAKFDLMYESKIGTLYKHKYYNYNGNASLFVRMGNICYPVTDLTSINKFWSNNYKLILNVNIGEVSFTTSREALEMTKNTLETINKYIEQIRAEMAKTREANINQCATPWEALCYYHNLDELTKSLLADKFAWRGKELDLQWAKNKGLEVRSWQYHNKKYSLGYAFHAQNYDKNLTLIVEDGGYPNYQRSDRLAEARNIVTAEHAKNDIKANCLLAKCSITTAKELMNLEELKGLNILPLSSITKFPVKARTNKKVFKNSEKLFKWKGTTKYPYSTNWDAVDAPKGTKVYVNIDSFRPTNKVFGQAFKNIVYAFKNIGINLEIYGVKKGQKIDSSFIELGAYIESMVKIIKSDKTFADIYMNARVNNLLERNKLVQSIFDGSFQAADLECSIMKKLINRLNKKSITDKYDAQIYLLNWSDDGKNYLKTLQDKAEAEAKLLWKDVNDCLLKYPLLMDEQKTYSYSGYGDKKAKHLTNYINAMIRSGMVA